MITVAGVRCRWRIRFGEHDASLTIQSAVTKGGQQAIVTFPGYPDFWLHFPDPVPLLIVTPALVRSAVERALALGWQPQERVPALTFIFHPEPVHAA